MSIPTTTIGRDAWLAARRSGIGASDSAAILGLSPYSTALEVYMSKVDPLFTMDREKQYIKMGQILEPVTAKMYAQAKGVTLRKPEAITRHISIDWMIASLDYVWATDNCIVECKKSRTPIGWGEEGTDEVPRAYWVQAQHQMVVSGINFCDIAVLIGGEDFRIYPITYDREFCDKLIEVLGDFWHRHVLKAVPPSVDWDHPSVPALISAMHTKIEPITVELGHFELRMAKELVLLQQVERETQKEIKDLKAKLKHAVGDARHGQLPNGWMLSRNEVTRSAYQVDAKTYIDFRVKQTTKKK